MIRRGSQHDGLADEFLVTADPEIRHYRVADASAPIDQVRSTTHADP
jgi:hypothetical protein